MDTRSDICSVDIRICFANGFSSTVAESVFVGELFDFEAVFGLIAF
jgi:hypothetical protein